MESVTNGGAATSELGLRLAGKYMTFLLDREHYGLRILEVREIVGFMEITRVPRVEEFVRGVVNLRGKVIPVVDLRLKFGLPRCEATDQTVIIVVQSQVDGKPLTMGLLVDQVLEVLNVDAGSVEPTPSFGSASTDNDFIVGVGKHDRHVVFLLDIARILSVFEARQVAGAAVA